MKCATVLMLLLVMSATPARAAVEFTESQRLDKAKDYIADEQWTRAIEVLRAAAADTRERNKDEALFWLAHSLHQARDLGAAVEMISELERQFPASRWVKPARSLRVEIAQKLRRNDVLWWAATPPPAVSPATAPPPPRPRAPAPPAPLVWIPEHWNPDTDLRIQALGSLMSSDSARVIPMLKEIAFASQHPHEASRAVFVLAQSGRPEAHSTVVDVAMRGSESVRVAAVRELGRFGGPKVSEELLEVYRAGNTRVKYQVVNSLGERSAARALMTIAESES
ncbi:MAG TPA: HEAT repeat domain-containing protein, partial [Vicinamibacterales bacterium]|nr:HEAT repeat domain-containing protein [Vicinamibacterales bacterium]